MNTLAGAGSAYLRSAAHQPVHWREWSPAAFEEARRLDRPVLLDIGAVWCHWCHVMDGESYEDPGLADFLNQHFTCIKVDRDERPDVDLRYQRAVQALTGQGGWPLTAVLTPDGELFFGGTYFPPDDRYGRPGFRNVLTRVLGFWKDHRGRVLEQAGAIREGLAARTDRALPGEVTAAALLAAERQMLSVYDEAWGGFGSAPKFPHPGALRFLLGRWADGGSSRLRHVARESLLAMARGGIHDHLGGGFHRYSVDRQWVIPHFEKMSYDNSELLHAFAEAGAMLGDGECLAAARGIIGWVREVLAHPGTGYGTSQDADVGPEDDGSYFTWTRAELAAVLTADELAAAERRFGLGTAGAMPHDPARNVLFLATGVDDVAAAIGRPAADTARLLESAVEKLRAARARRTAPVVDPSRYTSWNAMMASALLRAAPVVDDDWARTHALATLEAMRGPDALPHAPGVEGLLEDQVHSAQAALDAFEATGSEGWLHWAEALMERTWADYHDLEGGGLFDTARGRGGPGLLGQAAKPIEDSPVPSPNGVAGVVFARLQAHTGEARWGERHRAQVEAFAGAARFGLHAAAWLAAADWLLHPAVHLVVTGPAGDPEAGALHRRALAVAAPRRVVRRLLPGADASGLPPALAAMLASGEATRGYVCLGDRCLEPAAGMVGWEERLVEVGRREGR